MVNIRDNRRIVKNTVFLYIRMILVMGISLYTVRAVLSQLGSTDYGLYNVIGGFVSMFSFISGTLSSSSQRYFSISLAKNDFKKLNDWFCLNLNLFIIIVILLILIAETLGIWFVNNKMTIPAERLTAANVIFQLSLLGFCCNLVNIPYLALIIAYEKMKAFAYIGILEAFSKLVIVAILYFVSADKLILYGILVLLMNVSITLFYIVYVSRKISHTRYYLYWNMAEITELASFSSWHLLGTISVVLRGQGINVLLNVFFNPVVNAARAIAFQIESAVMQLQNNFFMALKPQIYKLYAVHDYSQLHILIVKSTQICFFFTSILSIPLLFELEKVLDLWLVEVPEHTKSFTILVLVNGMIDSMSGPMITPILATGKIRNFYLFTGNLIILTLPVSYVALHYGYSSESVFVVTIVFSVLAMMCRMYFLHRLIEISFLKYTVEIIKLFSTTIVICINIMLLRYVMHDNVIRFVAVIIFSSMLHLIMYYSFVISDNERKALNGYVGKFCDKIRKRW